MLMPVGQSSRVSLLGATVKRLLCTSDFSHGGSLRGREGQTLRSEELKRNDIMSVLKLFVLILLRRSLGTFPRSPRLRPP